MRGVAPTTGPLPSVRIRVAADGKDLKVIWLDSIQDRGPYLVFRARMEAAADKSRRLLAELGDLFLRDPNPDYGPKLQELARAGAVMRHLLLCDTASERSIAEEIDIWFQKKGQRRLRLVISADSDCHLPWGLIYDGDVPDDIPANATIEDFPGFWGIKYSLAVLYNRMHLVDDDVQRPRESFKCVFVLHEEEHANVLDHLSNDEAAYLTQLVSMPEGEVRSWQAARKAWLPIADCDSIIYVFCHSDGVNLQLKRDEADVNSFSLIFPKRRQSPSRDHQTGSSICILNGCSTANGLRDNGFRTATARPGFLGFVGTEAPIPAEFAARFGMAFLHCLVEQGLSVQESIDNLRHQHWPLSLFYANCAYPDYRVDGVQPVERPIFSAGANYSNRGSRWKRTL